MDSHVVFVLPVMSKVVTQLQYKKTLLHDTKVYFD